MSLTKLVSAVAFAGVIAIFAFESYRAHDVTIVNVSRTAMFNVQEALQTFYSRHGRLPEATTTKDGYPHSWRTQVENSLRKQYKDDTFATTEPWDSAANLSLAMRSYPHGGFDLVLRHRKDHGVGRTCFFVVTGKETAFPLCGSVSLQEIQDGLENTVLVIEVSGSQFPWIQPIDIHFTELKSLYDGKHELSLGSHSRGTGLLFADMSRYFLVQLPSFDVFQSLFTRAGGEPWTREQLIEQGFLVPMSAAPGKGAAPG